MNAGPDLLTRSLAEFATHPRSADMVDPVRDCARRLTQQYLTQGAVIARTDVGEQLRSIVAAADGRVAASASPGAVFSPLPAMSRSSAVTINTGLMTIGTAKPNGRGGAAPLIAGALAAGFAAANLVSSDGSRLLSAFSNGLEIGLRLAAAVESSRPGSGWATERVPVAIAAAVTVASLLDGGPRELHEAIGLGATLASGLGEPDSGGAATLDAAFVAGELAARGFESGVLATLGWEGPKRPLVGSRGFFSLLAAAPAPASITDGLGSTWLMLSADASPDALLEGVSRPLDSMSPAELDLILGG